MSTNNRIRCKHGHYDFTCPSCYPSWENSPITYTWASSNGGDSSYYEFPKDCDRVQDLIIKKDMTWNQANIFKAVYRWGHKPDLEYNLRKILWFAQDELDRLYERERPRTD